LQALSRGANRRLFKDEDSNAQQPTSTADPTGGAPLTLEGHLASASAHKAAILPRVLLDPLLSHNANYATAGGAGRDNNSTAGTKSGVHSPLALYNSRTRVDDSLDNFAAPLTSPNIIESSSYLNSGRESLCSSMNQW